MDNQWTFRNNGNGRYLGLGGNASDGTPLLGVDEPVRWDIWPDERDGNVYRHDMPLLSEGVTSMFIVYL